MKWESWRVNTGHELGKQMRASMSWINNLVLVKRRSRARFPSPARGNMQVSGLGGATGGG